MKNILKYAGFGIGALGMDLSYGLFFSFASIYLTDILYFSPAFLLVLSFTARIWDGINDPIMGAIVDSTKSRFGKYRIWMLIGAACNAVVLALLFTNPGFACAPGRVNPWLYVYVTVLYVLWGITNTMMDIPYWSMVPSLTTDPKERNIAATVPRAFSGLGQGIVTVAVPVMIPLLGRREGLNAPGFSRWAMLCGAALIGLMLAAFFTTGKIKAVAGAKPSGERITPRSVIKTLRSNDQLLVFMLVALLANTGWYLVTGLAAYYFERVLGNLQLMSLFWLLAGAGQAAGLLLLPVLTKWLKRNTVIKLAMGMAAAGYLGMYASRGSLPLFVVFCIIGMTGVGSSFVAQTIMLSDIVDYGEYKLGYRSDSVIFSMKGFLQKGAYTLQSVIMYSVFHLTGYDGALAAQPQAAQTAITVMMFLVPPALVALALWIFGRKYRLDEERMREVNAGKNIA